MATPLMTRPPYAPSYSDRPPALIPSREERDAADLQLFRRAIVERDEYAWAVIYLRYTGLVRWWLGAKLRDDDGLVAEVFERFWRAIDAEKFAQFTALGSILKYLKMCASSTRLDRARAEAAAAHVASLDRVPDSTEGDDAATPLLIGQASRQFWSVVQRYLPDRRERLVLYLSYVSDLRPREICATYRVQVGDIESVYALKRSALNRLRREPAIHALLGANLSS